jgi:hypothetical protein
MDEASSALMRGELLDCFCVNVTRRWILLRVTDSPCDTSELRALVRVGLSLPQLHEALEIAQAGSSAMHETACECGETSSRSMNTRSLRNRRHGMGHLAPRKLPIV